MTHCSRSRFSIYFDESYRYATRETVVHERAITAVKFIYGLISFISIAGGVAILVSYSVDPSGNLPSYEGLNQIEGEIAWVQDHRYGVRFGFKNDDRRFNYPSKARELGVVRRSLESASGARVTILVDLGRSNSPLYNDKVYFTVFEIRINDSVVRSFAEVSEEWMSDQRLMPYLGAFGIFAGTFIFWWLRRQKKPAR